jgi:hypothetical protein
LGVADYAAECDTFDGNEAVVENQWSRTTPGTMVVEAQPLLRFQRSDGYGAGIGVVGRGGGVEMVG